MLRMDGIMIQIYFVYQKSFKRTVKPSFSLTCFLLAVNGQVAGNPDPAPGDPCPAVPFTSTELSYNHYLCVDSSRELLKLESNICVKYLFFMCEVFY